jgi:uncharacterized protein (DUF1778 family)
VVFEECFGWLGSSRARLPTTVRDKFVAEIVLYGRLAYTYEPNTQTFLFPEGTKSMQAGIKSPANVRGSRLEARISNEQKALFQQAAMLSTRTLSEFVVASAQEAATRIIEAHETIRLEREDQIRFVQALLNPPEPNDRLLQASEQYRAMMGV